MAVEEVALVRIVGNEQRVACRFQYRGSFIGIPSRSFCVGPHPHGSLHAAPQRQLQSKQINVVSSK